MKEKGLQIIHYQEGHERRRKIKIRNISSASFSSSADQKSCSNVAENADDIADDIGRYADNTDNISSANNDQNHAQNTVADDADDMNDIIHDLLETWRYASLRVGRCT